MSNRVGGIGDATGKVVPGVVIHDTILVIVEIIIRCLSTISEEVID
jgi:hypothetical protein